MALYSGNKTKKNTLNRTRKFRIGVALSAASFLLILITLINIIPPFTSFMFGAFGLFTYALYLLLGTFGVLLILDKKVYLETIEIVYLAVWFFLFLCLIHLATTTAFIENSYGQYLSECYNVKYTAGGAVLGLFVYMVAGITHAVAGFILFAIGLLIISALMIERYYRYTQNVKNNIKQESVYTVKEEIEEPIQKQAEKNSEDNLFVADEKEATKQDRIISTQEKDKNRAKELLFNKEYAEPVAEKKKRPMFTASEAETEPVQTNFYQAAGRPAKFIHQPENKPVSNVSPYSQQPLEKPAKQLTESDKKNLEFLKDIGIGGQTLYQQEDHVYQPEEDKRRQASAKLFNAETVNQPTPAKDIYDANITKNNYKQTYANPNAEAAKEKLFIRDDEISANAQPVTKIVHYNDEEAFNNEPNYTNPSRAAEPQREAVRTARPQYNQPLPVQQPEPEAPNNYSYTDDAVIRASSLPKPRERRTYSNSIPPAPQPPINTAPRTYNQVTPPTYSQMRLDGLDEPKPTKKLYKKPSKYNKPPVDLLKVIETVENDGQQENNEKAELLERTLAGFKIPAKVISITKGPAFTRFELQMQQGVSVKRVTSFIDDIAMTLESQGDVRVEIPIAGKNAFGVEVPNETVSSVGLRDILESYAFQGSKSHLTFGLGKDITGDCKVTRLDKMPHLLVAGATGSGKSVCLNSLLISLIYKTGPDDVRFILIDPKSVEFTLYNGLPHLLIPRVITDPGKAIDSLNWAITEMERRFTMFSNKRVRNMEEYNQTEDVINGTAEKIPYLVIVVDELADLMLQGKKEVEEKIMRIAQKSRAAGIHLVIATQRPSVDVITGTIKANLPSRIAFAVTSFADSKTILDAGGADKLLGKGDMLFSPLDMPDPTRIQGAFVSNEEVEAVINYVKEHNPDFDFDSDIEDQMFNKKSFGNLDNPNENEEFDSLMKDALRVVIRSGRASISAVQRMFGVGYPRAGKIVDQMEKAGFISPSDAKNNRTIYITEQEFEERFGEEV